MEGEGGGAAGMGAMGEGVGMGEGAGMGAGMPRGPPAPPAPPADMKEWTIIYPCYIDPSKSVKQGRRLPKSAVEGCEGVSVQDIGELATTLGLRAMGERKVHPQADLSFEMGRARVKLFYTSADEGKEGPVDARFPTKRAFLKYCGEHIPKMERFALRKVETEKFKQALFDAINNRTQPMMPGMAPPPTEAAEDEEAPEAGAGEKEAAETKKPKPKPKKKKKKRR